jgi:hypothetical protein
MKYKYHYVICTNNLCYGHLKLAEYPNRKTAEFMKNILVEKYGCCDIERKRYYIQEV